MNEARIKYNPSFAASFFNESRYHIEYGGSGSGKSYFCAQKIIHRLLTEAKHRFLVIRKVRTTIRASTYQLFLDVLTEAGIPHSKRETDHFIRVGSGSIIQAGLDDAEKIKSIQRITGVWIEEATELTESDFDQLDLRLRGNLQHYKQILLSFNPISGRHWLKKRFFDKPNEDVYVHHTTVKDNRESGTEYLKVLEGLRDEDTRRVYLLGQWGQGRKGLILPDWKPYAKEPEGMDEMETCYGLDVGYVNPTALVQLWLHENTVYAKQLLYKKNMKRQDIVEAVRGAVASDDVPVYVDSANPEVIDELAAEGVNAWPAKKDVLQGIGAVRNFDLRIHGESDDLIAELQGYKWKTTRDGEPVDVPVKQNDHAIDALRYGIYTAWGSIEEPINLVL